MKQTKVKVNITGWKRYKGYSDLIPTYCCELIPSYFVTFPNMPPERYFDMKSGVMKSIPYGTYFHTKDVKIVK